jgi:hypothetical protein
MTSWTSSSGGAFLFVGLVLGMRHALEPDHLAAVSTLVTERQRAGWGALVGTWLGMLWGLGHTVALLVVASLLALVGTELPSRVAVIFELGVSLMLVVLGARALRRAWTVDVAGRPGPHRHATDEPVALVPADRSVRGSLRRSVRRALAVGMVHGLAGSGALTALVASCFPSLAGRLLTVALFGIGSMIGMAALSGIAGWPLARLGRDPRMGRLLSAISGVIALGLGFGWGWPLVNQLLTV